MGENHPFSIRIRNVRPHQSEALAMLLMLLASGMEPDDKSINMLKRGRNDFGESISTIRERLVRKSEHWLQSLQCSRKIFRDIFDNEELENDLCAFIYTEKNLRKITVNLIK